jgi:hypothetical protein
MVPTVVTSYPDVLVLCSVISCMTLVLTELAGMQELVCSEGAWAWNSAHSLCAQACRRLLCHVQSFVVSGFWVQLTMHTVWSAQHELRAQLQLQQALTLPTRCIWQNSRGDLPHRLASGPCSCRGYMDASHESLKPPDQVLVIPLRRQTQCNRRGAKPRLPQQSASPHHTGKSVQVILGYILVILHTGYKKVIIILQ